MRVYSSSLSYKIQVERNIIVPWYNYTLNKTIRSTTRNYVAVRGGGGKRCIEACNIVGSRRMIQGCVQFFDICQLLAGLCRH